MATENAIYLHHERTLTADLEADLQTREIGIDPVLKMLTASSAVLGAKIHAVTQESPSIAFAGSVTVAGSFGVTGAVTLVSTLAVQTDKLRVAANGRVIVNSASDHGETFQVDGTSYFNGASNITGNATIGTGAGAPQIILSGATSNTRGLEIRSAGSIRWYMYANSDAESGSDAGSSWRLSAYTDAAAYIDNPISITRAAGGAVTLARPVSMASTLGVTGAVTLLSTMAIDGAIILAANSTAGAGRIFRTASGGMTLRGLTASTNDFEIESVSGADLLINPTGTNNLTFPNAVSMSSTLGVTGNVTLSSSNSGAINTIKAENTSNTSASGVKVHLKNGGTSGGDPYVHLEGGATSYTLGLLESNDGFYLSNAATVSTSDAIFKYQGGNFTIEKSVYINGSLLAHNARAQSPSIIDSTTYTISSVGEVFIQKTNACTYTLPAVNAISGRILTIINKNSTTTNNVTVNRAGSDTFDGSGTSITLVPQGSGTPGFTSATFYSEGSSIWYVEYKGRNNGS